MNRTLFLPTPSVTCTDRSISWLARFCGVAAIPSICVSTKADPRPVSPDALTVIWLTSVFASAPVKVIV